jgi:hypothetical protein
MSRMLPARSGQMPIVSEQTIDESIYEALGKHQREEPWRERETMAFLQAWTGRLIVEFKLDIPHVALCVERLPANRYGHFRSGHNGFGLQGEIAINSRYLTGRRPAWEVLGTLAHELLHAWQQVHGKPGDRNHHNCEFRDKAEELGLLIDEKGITGYAAHSPFKELLQRFGVNVPFEEVVPQAGKPRGDSKQKKWTCGCTNVRVAVKTFKARCLLCGNEFYQDDTPGRARYARRQEASMKATSIAFRG